MKKFGEGMIVNQASARYGSALKKLGKAGPIVKP